MPIKFNKSMVSVCVSGALFASAVLAETATNAPHIMEQKTTSEYIIQLKSKAALSQGSKKNSDYSQEANAVTKQQEALFQDILTLDPNAKLIASTRLLSNLITVEISNSAADKISALASVNSINAIISNPFPLAKNSIKKTQTRILSTDDTEEITFASPYLDSETAGAGASVAIISTGIDYTLPIFGGSGEYGDDGDPTTPPPSGSYLDAFENGAMGPSVPAVADDPSTPEDESAPAIEGFDGFPTDVVVGGWDFSSENNGNDANPIDQNLEYTSWQGWVYPTGKGTKLASIVHQLAPGADLYAYKVSNVSYNSYYDDNYGSSAQLRYIFQAFEHALDPNQDGDTSDHVDVVLVESSGAAAFYQPHGMSGSVAILTQQLIQSAAAQGMTVVVSAGEYGHTGTYGDDAETTKRGWLAYEAAAPAAITVGSAQINADEATITPTKWSPMGPVRGNKDLKPEVMSFGQDIPVALISNADAGAATKSTRSSGDAAAARIAAAIAVIKAAHPTLGPIELKALLANTADHNIKEVDFNTGDVLEQAELLYIGHGIENVAAAITSPIAVWDSENNQPNLQFGFHEVADTKVITKQLTLRNLSDTAQTYALSHMVNGDKPAHAALQINYPSSVSIPANHAVTILVEMTIDGAALPAWPVTSSADYTDEILKSTELNGYFQLSSDEQPQLNVGWMVQARPKSSIDKTTATTVYPIYGDLGTDEEDVNLDWAAQFYQPDDMGFAYYSALTTKFTNESTTPTTYEVYPVVINKTAEPEGMERVYGHKIKTVASAIYDEAQCESGKKIAMAVNFWQPADMAIANYPDKIGIPLFSYELFSQEIVTSYEFDKSFNGGYIPDSETVAVPWVEIDKNGQPATYYDDLDIPYDYTQPRNRIRKSKLPVRISPNSTNVVSEICLDELYHHDIDSVEYFDQNMGLFIQTDRDSQTEQFEPLTQFNPMRHGYYAMEEICYFGMFGPVCEESVIDQTVHAGFAITNEENPEATAEYSHTLTIEPNEQVTIAAVFAELSFQMDPTSEPVIPEMLLISTDDNFALTSPASFMDADGQTLSDVRAGQEFSIAENTESGTVVGKIKLDTAGLFGGTYETELVIVSALPGSPFSINQETNELVVANPAALNFEQNPQFEVMIQHVYGKNRSAPVSVMVWVNNINDIAPELMTTISNVAVAVTNDSDAVVAIDVSSFFVDIEGDSLTFSVSGLPAGISYNDGMISGATAVTGTHLITVTASDGIHETSASFELAVADEKKSSGGSFGAFMLAFAGLSFLRRRR